MTMLEFSNNPDGYTLIEMLIVIVLLGILAAVATLSVRSVDAPSPDDPRRILAESARIAALDARAVHVSLVLNGRRVLAALGPDGSIVADSAFGADTARRASPHAPRE